MAISFSQIPNDLLVPGAYTEIDATGALSISPALPNRVLIQAPMLSGGTGTAEQLYQVADQGQEAAALFGNRSAAAAAVRRFKQNNSLTELWVQGVADDGGATETLYTATFSGTATAAGSVALTVAGYRVATGVALGDDAVAVAESVTVRHGDAAFSHLPLRASHRHTATFGGTETDGDYDLIFTGFGLGAPVTVTVTRSTTPATNDDLAVAMDAELDSAAAASLAGVIRGISNTGSVVTFHIEEGLSGTVTDAAPGSGTLTAEQTGVVEFYSAHSGLHTSTLRLLVNYFAREVLPAGISVVIAQSQAGATNPDLTSAIAAIPSEMHFTSIVSGYNDDANLTLLETEALSRWDALRQLDTLVFSSIGGEGQDFAAAQTFALTRNSQFSTVPAYGTSPTPDYEATAIYAGAETGEPDPARPRKTLPLLGLLPPPMGERFTFTNYNDLLKAGLSTVAIDSAGNSTIQRAITTYLTNALDAADPTFRNVTTLRTIAALRFTTNNRILTKYPRSKLADDGTLVPPGQPIVTPSVIRSEMISLYMTTWTENGWVEPAGLEQFKEELSSLRSTADVDRLDVLTRPDLINQFIIFAHLLQFRL